jgi:hypothetical protein
MFLHLTHFSENMILEDFLITKFRVLYIRDTKPEHLDTYLNFCARFMI